MWPLAFIRLPGRLLIKKCKCNACRQRKIYQGMRRKAQRTELKREPGSDVTRPLPIPVQQVIKWLDGRWLETTARRDNAQGPQPGGTTHRDRRQEGRRTGPQAGGTTHRDCSQEGQMSKYVEYQIHWVIFFFLFTVGVPKPPGKASALSHTWLSLGRWSGTKLVPGVTKGWWPFI